MRITPLLVLSLIVMVVFTLGCDSGTDTYSIDGDYSVGTVQFVYGGDNTWTLRDVIITIDTSASEVFFSGIDRDGALWGYSGRYRRTDNRIVASDLPEVDFGSEDQLDLRVEFTSSSRFEGVAINWVYNNDDLTDVGAANITGRETFIAAVDTRSATATGAEKTSKLEITQ